MAVVRESFSSAAWVVSLCAIALSFHALLQDAQAQPPGAVLQIITFASDDAVVCSVHDQGRRIGAVISRVDGKKIERKPFWNLAATRKRIKVLEQQIDELIDDRSVVGQKRLKKARGSLKRLSKVRQQLVRCARERNRDVRALSPVKFTHVRPLIEAQCMNCHGVLGWENTNEFFSSTGRVVARDREASPFYVFLSNNPEGYLPGYMPKGGAPLSDIQLRLLGRWIDDLDRTGPEPTPTPGGEEGEGRALYATNCGACHGAIDVSSKWGKTEAQILAAMQEVPQMRHLRLTSEEVRKVALALSRVRPPQEGTVSVQNIGPAVEGNDKESPRVLQFEVTLTGGSSRPFTVGYVTSSGTALAGSDFVFAAGTLSFEGRNGESKIVSVEIIGDNFAESDESLMLDIGGVSHGGVRVFNSTATGLIVNDDVFSEVAPPASSAIRMAFGFNGNYRDAITPLSATAQGAPTLSPSARVGSGAVEFSTSADHVTVPGQNLQGATSFTFASWVYWQNSASISSRLFDFGSAANSYIYFLPRDSAGRCRFEMRVNGGTVFTLQCPVNTRLPDNVWAHLAVSYQASTGEMRIFINGQQVAQRSGVTLSLPTLLFSDNRLAKSRVGTDVDFVGRLDEVMVWDAALTQPDVAAVMSLTRTPVVSAGFEVQVDNQVIPNGGTIQFGDVPTGDSREKAVFVTSRGQGGIEFLGTPIVEVVGPHRETFQVLHQVWPWQRMLTRGAVSVFSLRQRDYVPGLKQATVRVLNSDGRDGNFAALLEARNTGSAIASPDPGFDPNSELGRGQQLYLVNCASCHGAFVTSTKRGATEARILQAMDPVSGVPSMRALGLTTEQVRLIALALNAPLPERSEAAVAEEALMPLGTAFYVESFLSDIFLPYPGGALVAEDNTIRTRIRENVLGLRSNLSTIPQRIRHFGGRCDRFDDDPDNPSDAPCQPEAMVGQLSPSTNAVRSGLIVRACDEVLSIDRAVDNLLAKIGRVSTDPVRPSDVNALSRLFFSERQMPAYLAEVMANYSQGLAGLSARDHWRHQAHLLCVSNGWEGL